MISVKDAQGTTYEAAKHSEVYGLQKITEAQSKRTTVCYSYFQPNGGAEMSSSPKERVYYVVKGSITVCGHEEEHVLNPGDLSRLLLCPVPGRQDPPQPVTSAHAISSSLLE